MPVYCEQETEETIRRVFSYAFRPGTEQWPAGFVPKLQFVRIAPGVEFEVLGQTRPADPARARAVAGPGFSGRRAGLLHRCQPDSRRELAAAGGAGRPDPGCAAVRAAPDPLFAERGPRGDRGVEAAADVLDASVAQLRSWSDAGQPAASCGPGLRWAATGVLSGIRVLSSSNLEGRVPFSGVWYEMSPDPVLVDRLNQHGQSHLLRWWEELNDEERARLAAEIASIDFEQLDRLIAELVRRRRGDGPAGGPGPADRGGSPAPDRRRARGAAPGRRDRGRRAGRGRGRRRSWWPAARARGWASRDRKGPFPIGPVSSASLFQIHAEKIVALGRRYGRPIPLYIMTSPENHEATIAFFESQRPVRPGARPVLHPGADAGRRSRDRQGPAGVEGPRCALARRPRRHAGRPGRARAGRDAELPGRDARARRPDALLLPGGQSAGPDRRTRRSSACTARPTPRCRSRSSSGSRPTRSWAWS